MVSINSFGQPHQRDLTLNWAELGLPKMDLSHLKEEFTDEEVHAAIQDLASDKAPGPDGYVGIFFKHS
jgi:hypothetical protein